MRIIWHHEEVQYQLRFERYQGAWSGEATPPWLEGKIAVLEAEGAGEVALYLSCLCCEQFTEHRLTEVHSQYPHSFTHYHYECVRCEWKAWADSGMNVLLPCAYCGEPVPRAAYCDQCGESGPHFDYTQAQLDGRAPPPFQAVDHDPSHMLVPISVARHYPEHKPWWSERTWVRNRDTDGFPQQMGLYTIYVPRHEPTYSDYVMVGSERVKLPYTEPIAPDGWVEQEPDWEAIYADH